MLQPAVDGPPTDAIRASVREQQRVNSMMDAAIKYDQRGRVVPSLSEADKAWNLAQRKKGSA